MFQFCSVEKYGVGRRSPALRRAPRERAAGFPGTSGVLAIWCTVPGLQPRKGTPVYREHEEEAFYLAKWTILGLGAFGVSLLICAMFI
jgi:hypothetical protein